MDCNGPNTFFFFFFFPQQGLTTNGNSSLLSTRKNAGNRQNSIIIALSPTVDDSLKSTLETTGSSTKPTPSVLPGISLRSVSANTTDAVDSVYLPLLGLLGCLGFALADNGYVASMFMLKAYTIAVTPASQHDNVFIMVILTGAVGGCVTTLLGFIDLRSLFPSQSRAGVLDRGMAQCLVQAAVLWVMLLAPGMHRMGEKVRRISHPKAETKVH